MCARVPWRFRPRSSGTGTLPFGPAIDVANVSIRARSAGLFSTMSRKSFHGILLWSRPAAARVALGPGLPLDEPVARDAGAKRRLPRTLSRLDVGIADHPDPVPRHRGRTSPRSTRR